MTAIDGVYIFGEIIPDFFKFIQRTIVGKKVKQLRREGWVPAVIYGQSDPVTVQVERAEVDLVCACSQRTGQKGPFPCLFFISRNRNVL